MYTSKYAVRKKKRTHTHASAIALALILAGSLLSQTVSAKTYVITDGDQVITYTTFSTDPTEVLEQAGMEPE